MKFEESFLQHMPEKWRAFFIKHREFIRFAVVGGITFIIDNAVFYALTLTVMHQKATIAKILAVTIAVICSYALNSQWAFQERGGKRSTREAVSFFVVSAIGIVINAIPLWFSRNVLGLALTSHGGRLTSQLAVSLWDFLFGSIIGMLLAMLWRWWAFDKFVFPEKSESTRRHFLHLCHQQTMQQRMAQKILWTTRLRMLLAQPLFRAILTRHN